MSSRRGIAATACCVSGIGHVSASSSDWVGWALPWQWLRVPVHGWSDRTSSGEQPYTVCSVYDAQSVPLASRCTVGVGELMPEAWAVPQSWRRKRARDH